MVVSIDVANTHVDVPVLDAKFDVQQFDNQAQFQWALAAAVKALNVAMAVMNATSG